MKIKLILVLAAFLTHAVFAAAQSPTKFATNDMFSIHNKSTAVNRIAGLLQNSAGNFNALTAMKIPVFANQSAFNKSNANCDDSASAFAPEAAPCNGVSVTSISFTNANRTIESGADKTVGVVYRYTGAGTTPDGTVVDALVTVQNYANNQDATPTTFRDADTTAVGFAGNLQPSIDQETGTFATTTSVWTGSITYRIQFVVTGTTTPRRISVAATSIDNDGSSICGVGLRESVTYSSNRNQTLINTSTPAPGTTQVVAGDKVTGPTTTQNDIGVAPEYSNSALYINVTELSWTYSFATDPGGNCAAGATTQNRYGSLNLSCQVTYNRPFASVPLSGTVFNDANGLTDSTVNGTGTGLPGGAQLYANLLDANNFVVSSVAVAVDGTYTFPAAVPGAYNVQISTNQGIESSAAPIAALPAGWVNTGENLGTGAGNDGSVDGLLPVVVGAAAIANANFGIEQRPTAASNTATAQTNPGGTNNATVPATVFSGGDTAPGTVTGIRITAFPTNATSITINGTQYTAANFPAGGVTVPAGTNGNPTQAILVNPISGAVTVAISYSTIDNAGVSSAAAVASVPFISVSISGTVLNDVNGLTDSIVNGAGTNAGGPLYANLLDSGGNVVQRMLVPASGVYSFTGLDSGSYTIQISTNQGTIGSPAPATALPTDWVNTGENLGTAAGSDGSVNGLLPVVVGSTAVANANFGIEQRPVANNNTAASQTNPGGTVNATVPATAFTATDSAPGTVASIRITAFPTNATSITINGTQYTAATFPAGGVTVPAGTNGNPTQAILVDPINGAVTVGIPYVAIDNAGVAASATATASVPFATVSLSGTVFNDVNGLTDSIVNGAGTNVGGTLYANLLDAGNNVVATTTVAANGTYTLAGLNSGNYTVQISINQGTVGNPAPVKALPAGWVNTGENLGVSAGNDGTVNGLLPVVVGAVAIANANFGIEQRPVANNNTAPSQTNPGGTVSVAVPPTAFTATDTGVVSSIRITAFPTNATTITINGTQYNAGNFPSSGVTVPTNVSGNPMQAILVDPIDRAVTVVIPYVAIDNAGVESSIPPTTASVSVPFTFAPTAARGEISGKLYFGANPIRGALVVLIDTTLNVKAFTRTDANGDYAFTDKEIGRTYVVQPLSGKYSFASTNSVVNLLDDAIVVDFNSTSKTYHPKNDFDGDGKSDVAVFRPSDGNWYVLRSSDEQMSVFNFGLGGDVPVSADFDGDGTTDYAVFRPSEGNWYIWQSKTQKLRVENFGLADDKLVPADYDGDGRTDVAVYRNGNWYIRRSSDGSFESKNFGLNADIPITEDFDADGRADFSVYRPSDRIWYRLHSSNGSFSADGFGLSTDVPVAADFDGDGFADIAQFRTGNWYVLNSTTGFEAIQFGSGKDESIVGDYDGDGRADMTVFRKGIWSIRTSGDGIVRRVSFGLSTDILVK